MMSNHQAVQKVGLWAVLKRTTISVTLHVLSFDNICHICFSVMPWTCRAVINPFCIPSTDSAPAKKFIHQRPKQNLCYNLKVCLQVLKIDKTRTISSLNSPHSVVQNTENLKQHFILYFMILIHDELPSLILNTYLNRVLSQRLQDQALHLTFWILFQSIPQKLIFSYSVYPNGFIKLKDYMTSQQGKATTTYSLACVI